MRVLVPSIFAAALLAAAPGARLAYAHGGQYRTPAGEVPPDSRQPEDPPPPDTGSGTPTPPDTGGGGTPTPPGGGGGTPTPPPDSGGTPTPPAGTGGGAPPSTGGGGPGTKTGKGPGKQGPSRESWRFWWNYNKDEILDVRRAVRAGMANSGGMRLSQSAIAVDGTEEAQDVTAKMMEEKVVPILEEYARNSKINFDIQSAAIIGLARIGRRASIPLMMQVARNNGSEQYNKVVEESAALALGIMQERTKQVRQFLGEVALDATAKTRTRCFAAFALGLLGTPDAAAGAGAESLEVLKAMACNPSEGNKEIASSALVAIGHLGDRAAVRDLVAWLKDEKAGANRLDDLQLSCVAAALGKIGRPGYAGPDSREVIDALKDQLKLRNRLTRYSVAIALGQIAPHADERIQKECVEILSAVVGAENRNGMVGLAGDFALISLGRIAGVAPGRDGRGGCPEAVRARAVEKLEAALQSRASSRSFASLGLGLAGMNLDESIRTSIAEPVRQALAKSSGDVEQRGAMCIALGLLKDIQASPLLQTLVQDKGIDARLRGTAALGLGLIGDRGAVEVVRAVLVERADSELRVDAAIAAGLLRDGRAVDTMVAVLKDPKSSQVVLGTLATALGQIGDRRAVEPLASILKDDKYPDLTRALACVALGQIGDRSDISVLSRMSKDVNYRAYYDAIGEVLTIL